METCGLDAGAVEGGRGVGGGGDEVVGGSVAVVAVGGDEGCASGAGWRAFGSGRDWEGCVSL